MLVDAEVGLMDSDKMLIDMLTEINVMFFLVMTKADKLRKESVGRVDDTIEFTKRAGSLCCPVVHLISAQKVGSKGRPYGLDELLSNFIFHLDQDRPMKP